MNCEKMQSARAGQVKRREGRDTDVGCGLWAVLPAMVHPDFESPKNRFERVSASKAWILPFSNTTTIRTERRATDSQKAFGSLSFPGASRFDL